MIHKTTPIAMAIILSTTAFGAAQATESSFAGNQPRTIAAPGAAAQPAKTVITSAEQLPRRTVKLDKLPSQYLEAPRTEVLALAASLEQNLRDDLQKFYTPDAYPPRQHYPPLMTLAHINTQRAAHAARAGGPRAGPPGRGR